MFDPLVVALQQVTLILDEEPLLGRQRGQHLGRSMGIPWPEGTAVGANELCDDNAVFEGSWSRRGAGR
jgi:hypothetical protein